MSDIDPSMYEKLANQYRSANGDAWQPLAASQSTQSENATDSILAFRWEAIDSARFFAADYRPQWLVEETMVAGQPGVVGGPQKTLKTSIVIDMAISLASGTAWLGKFHCPRVKRVAVASGESGQFALQETARRICAAKGIDPATLAENLRWQFRLPQLSRPEQLDILRAGLKRDGTQVVIIDPLYLSMLAGANGAKAENLFDTGPLLLNVALICESVGATPILLHHTTKPTAWKHEPLDLADLAFSGIAEFARQWLLINRREPFEPGSGIHRLWLAVGGSVGQSGLYALNVDEGKLNLDFSGRSWQVTVSPAAAAREAEKEKKASEKSNAKRRQDAEDEMTVVRMIDRLNADGGEGATKTRIRASSGISRERTDKALERLQTIRLMELAPSLAPGGNGAKQAAATYRRPAENGTVCDGV
ncbi:MAG TPA: AAA family ATPase [Gemmataceae bacterium]|jgi:replicative DNA helicase|nr:AAA family ATPase [Gemmataceae bacterium]